MKIAIEISKLRTMKIRENKYRKKSKSFISKYFRFGMHHEHSGVALSHLRCHFMLFRASPKPHGILSRTEALFITPLDHSFNRGI